MMAKDNSPQLGGDGSGRPPSGDEPMLARDADLLKLQLIAQAYRKILYNRPLVDVIDELPMATRIMLLRAYVLEPLEALIDGLIRYHGYVSDFTDDYQVAHDLRMDTMLAIRMAESGDYPLPRNAVINYIRRTVQVCKSIFMEAINGPLPSDHDLLGIINNMYHMPDDSFLIYVIQARVLDIRVHLKMEDIRSQIASGRKTVKDYMRDGKIFLDDWTVSIR